MKDKSFLNYFRLLAGLAGVILGILTITGVVGFQFGYLSMALIVIFLLLSFVG